MAPYSATIGGVNFDTSFGWAPRALQQRTDGSPDTVRPLTPPKVAALDTYHLAHESPHPGCERTIAHDREPHRSLRHVTNEPVHKFLNAPPEPKARESSPSGAAPDRRSRSP